MSVDNAAHLCVCSAKCVFVACFKVKKIRLLSDKRTNEGLEPVNVIFFFFLPVSDFCQKLRKSAASEKHEGE